MGGVQNHVGFYSDNLDNNGKNILKMILSKAITYNIPI